MKSRHSGGVYGGSEISISSQERIAAFLAHISFGKCWEWLGVKKAHGYGHFRWGGPKFSAHRIAFRIFKGIIPRRMCVCHTCDNPGCVNPDHLVLATPSWNMKDRSNKKRENHAQRIRVMKLRKASALLCLCLLIGASSQAQVLNTNANPPVISGPFIDLLGNLATATNWGVATFGIYTPRSSNHNKSGPVFGVGAVALYNFNQYIGAGAGIDYLDNQVTMPSAQFQLQAPFKVGGTNGVTFRPFAFSGIAVPVGGEGEDNGTVAGIIGAGMAVDIWKGFKGFWGIEQRTGQPAPWQIFGLEWSMDF